MNPYTKMILNPAPINHPNAKPTENKLIIKPCIKTFTKKTIHKHPYFLGNDLLCNPMILYEIKYISTAKNAIPQKATFSL